MNFLAHALLAGAAPADRLGAVLGDFVKGPLPAGLPSDVAAGVALHRRIDSFADAHPAFRRSRARVSRRRQRYGGIMVDMFYDHLLARHWAIFCDEPLEAFSARLYALLDAHPHLLPERLARVLVFMKQDNWLASYRDSAQVGLALDRLSRHRLSQPNPLAGAVEELERDYAGFESDFHDFLPAALRHVAELRPVAEILA